MITGNRIRYGLLIGALLTASLAAAQHDQHSDHSAHNHAGHASQQTSAGMDHSGHVMDHGNCSMGHSSCPMHAAGGSGAMDHSSHGASAGQPTQAGQDAFAAIQEIVALLSADPNTDWTQVNIDALRDHLIDMHLVTLYAQVQRENIDNGVRYHVTGQGETVGAIQRMVTAHARQVSSDTSWQANTTELSNGVTLTVTSAAAADVAKIRGLGFSGFMVQGNHHQPHHLMMAKGAFGHHH